MLRVISLLALICLCTACSPAATAAPTLTVSPSSTSTPRPSAPPATATASVTPGPSPTPEKKAYDYKTLYTDGSFAIRAAFLGTNAIWAADFKMPQARIENSAPSLNLGRELACQKQAGSPQHCSQTVELPLASGSAEKFTLGLSDPNGGTGTLYKNGRLIWSGYTNGGNSFAIGSSVRLGDEIAFDYFKSNWGTNEKPLWITSAIIVSDGNKVRLLPDGFGPNVIQDKLIYFRAVNRKEILIFDGKALGDSYDEVFNLSCCWHGPPIGIANNGKLIDFFAQKGSDWYHVQAGYFSGAN